MYNKFILSTIIATSIFSCSVKKEDPKPQEQAIIDNTPPIKEQQKDSLKMDNSGKYTVTTFATKIPYYYRRINEKAIWKIDTCRTNTCNYTENYVDPNKYVDGIKFGEYKFQASFNSTQTSKDSISILIRHESKSVLGVSSRGSNGVAIAAIKDLK